MGFHKHCTKSIRCFNTWLHLILTPDREFMHSGPAYRKASGPLMGKPAVHSWESTAGPLMGKHSGSNSWKNTVVQLMGKHSGSISWKSTVVQLMGKHSWSISWKSTAGPLMGKHSGPAHVKPQMDLAN